MSSIFIIHLFTTFFMTGLCWFVQLVHYPMFKGVRLEDFPAYQKRNFKTLIITAPIMTLELLTGLYLLYLNLESPYMINVLLLVVIGLSTALLQVPIHLKLAQKGSSQLIRRVIRTNWIRTLSWSIRSMVLLYLMLNVD